MEELVYDRINWFPGHMNRAIKEVKDKLKLVDIVLEIRDARSPLVTSNKAIISEIGKKPRLIVVNKKSLANPETLELWDKWFAEDGVPYVIVNGIDKNAISIIVQLSKDIINKNRFESNPDAAIKTKIKMMILGLPNTGKSTIINKLANRQASKAADKPGHTRQQLWVNVDSQLQILDTPGIMPPRIDKHEHGLWLAALHSIPDHVVAPELSACFIVGHLIETKNKYYKDLYKLDDLELDLISVLDHIGKLRGCIQAKGKFDYDRVYKIILSDFRSGKHGPVSLGIPPVRSPRKS